MNAKRITRRTLLKYASHTMILGALGRTFQETQAFGAEGKLKLLICTTPNGHFSSAATQAALSSALSPAILSADALFIEGLNNATTVNEGGQGVGDWHGGESALLSFNTGKSAGASFFSSIPGLSKANLGIGVGDRGYARDSSGGQVQIIENPQTAMATAFGQSLRKVNSYDLALIQSGQKHLLDPCMEDIKTLRKQLGADGAMFDDYLYALQESYRKIASANQGSGGGSGDPGSRFEAPGCNKNANIVAGNEVADQHQAMLDVAYQIMACDISQVTVLSFLNNNSDPQHNFIHSEGSNDGGMRFKQFCDEAQTRISGLVNKLGDGSYNILDRSAVVYMSEGGEHLLGGSFSSGHPQLNIPCAIFGKLGGAITQKGTMNAGGSTNRNLWRALADVMAGGNADLSDIGGDGVTPLSL
ncbi:DUF1552 domain-containing protein [Pseudobacteriovorax antillogorgiicola]|uniref:Tat (Twin-arginine translocation) pathway signal sequence n=1 Tax=Pseudobacteriovorax antillogorgiicola TaxID=1513793 RepID=A0A1Y6BHA0_9BACT|nr:DUF1552 domain-containing protein [Pseudobacteriovorax antillogorgiicola]TCS55514.1 uncharacterized protein DUF1552 [Pseudobacteriovorax antillogorgiicola]SMF11439.1 Protein of unknown function [Pseudobacteriovorax antillogorgiicola]